MGKHVVSTATANTMSTDGETLETLIDPDAPGYAGDVTPEQTYRYLETHKDAAIVDVRTNAEWQFVGVPDMREAGHELKLASWKTYPDFAQNPYFGEQLMELAPNKEIPIFFLCRSGGRSRDAAIFATQQGYRCCFNIVDGFEGEPDGGAKRGKRGGWKASGLPWCQT